MSDESQRWTLAFRDPALERAYTLEAARSWQRPYGYVALGAAVSWACCPMTNGLVCGTLGNAAAFTWVELALILPVVFAACVFAWLAPLTLFVRTWQGAIAAPLAAALGGMALACSLVPEPARFDPLWGVQGFALNLVGVCTVCGTRFVWAAIVCPPFSLAFAIVLATRWPGSTAPVMVAFVNGTTVFGIAGSYVLERLRRRAFLAERHADFERARSERLLHNVLPASVAEQLKDDGARIAEHFDEATVLFADIVGFTPLSRELSPKEIVSALDEIFSAFDAIAERLGVEKIKTIGDAYMVAGGVPTPRADHAEAVAEMALAMRAFVAGRTFAGGRQLRLRIGLHSGAVVAGVIGTKRLIYDLWGDTVNTASRMESHGVEDKVQVSDAVRERLGDRFELVERGPVQIKGKGEMRTWFLERRS